MRLQLDKSLVARHAGMVAATEDAALISRKAAFVSHPALLRPGFGQHHPLSTARQAAVVDLAKALGWLDEADIIQAQLPDRETLMRFHEPAYLAALERVSRDRLASADDRSRYNLGTMECPVFDGLWERARASVGGAIRAAELAVSGTVAFHPGGGTHHGRRDRAAGFCYLNDPVFAVLTLFDHGLQRVGYIDLDAHHGDGVALAFAEDPRVGLFSIHETGRWPGTGRSGTTANGRIVDIETPRGIGDRGYRDIIDRRLVPWLSTWGHDGVVVCLGADALDGDPLSTMGLTNHTLWAATACAIKGASAAVILGGGGYNPWTTVRLWAGCWGRLIGARTCDPLPAGAQSVLHQLQSDLVDADHRPPWWMTSLGDPEQPLDSPDSFTNKQ